jgi:hypothetical protein
MQRLGHRSHTAALRYQHATSERGREIADRLGVLMRAAQITESETAAEVRARFGFAIPRLSHADLFGRSQNRHHRLETACDLQCRRAGLRKTRVADPALRPGTIGRPEAGRVRSL